MTKTDHPWPRSASRWRGFTLVELLVAAAITALIAGLCVSLLAQTLRRWNYAQGNLAAEQGAREVLDRVERDLQSAHFRDDGGTWLAATVQATASASGRWLTGAKPAASSLNPATADLREARFGVAGVWLRLITAVSVPSTAGSGTNAPVAVSYQIIRRGRTPADPLPIYLLYRVELAPRAAFDAGYDLSSAGYNTISDAGVGPGSLVSPDYAHAIADNVIDFGLRCYRCEPAAASGTELVSIFPRDSSDLEFRVTASPEADPRSVSPPAVVDVFVRVISSEGARQLAALETGRMSGDWWSIARAHSRVYTRRVQLLSSLP